MNAQQVEALQVILAIAGVLCGIFGLVYLALCAGQHMADRGLVVTPRGWRHDPVLPDRAGEASCCRNQVVETADGLRECQSCGAPLGVSR